MQKAEKKTKPAQKEPEPVAVYEDAAITPPTDEENDLF
jgi:hypothetical protein